MKNTQERFASLSPLQKAYYKIQEYQTKIEQLNKQKTNCIDVAIIGIALKFPSANEPEEFWKNLIGEKDQITAFPESRKANLKDYYEMLGQSTENINFYKGAFLDEIDKFDYDFFGIDKKTAATMHPLQRNFLHVLWKALEDAHCLQFDIKNQKVGVYLGTSGDISFSQYLKMIEESELNVNSNALSGNTSSITSSRISYFLDLKGPALTIDTACSSSLVAVHQACRAIHLGDCDLAIAGGGRIILQPEDGKYQMGFESPTGRTKPFDANSDGAGIGEGIAAIVLKPLDKAIKDKDRIHAIIKGSAINQDGTSAGITAPNLNSQVKVIEEAWKNASVSAQDISFIETHGTGTSIGDPIEFHALKEAFSKVDKKNHCAIGAVKANIGHLFEAAGMAGLIKCILALKNKQIPATINHTIPNGEIDFNDSPFFLNTQRIDWESNNSVRTCGVSSFGISGTNAHIVLQEYETPIVNNKKNNSNHLFALSANSRENLFMLIDRYLNLLETNSNNTILGNICFSSNLNIGNSTWRFAVVVNSLNALKTNLQNPEKFVKEVSRKFAIEESEYKNCCISEGEMDINGLYRIANLFLTGGNINLYELYRNSEFRKTEVPRFPLKNTQCWLSYNTSEILKRQNETTKIISENIQKQYSFVELHTILLEMISGTTGFEKEELSKGESFFEMGIDSILIVDFIQTVHKKFKVKLGIGQFYEQLSDLNKLTDYLLDKINALEISETEKSQENNKIRSEKPSDKLAPTNINYFVPYKKIIKVGDLNLPEKRSAYLDNIALKLNQQTKTSKETVQNKRSVHANFRNVAGFHPQTKEMSYQLMVNKAKGSKVYDLDENEYIDLTMGFGVNILGYNPDFIQNAIANEMKNGFPLGPMSEKAGKVASMISELTGVERVAFYNTGSDAVMFALRIAKTFTKKSKYVMFKGSYHGTYDGTLALNNVLNPEESIPLAPGISDNLMQDVIVLDYGTDESLIFIEQCIDDLAAVIVEPVQSRRPDLQPKEFLKKLRKITSQANTALIFDEVITGFRISLGGAQEWFDIKADIAVYGKIVGGGLPIGVVGGAAKFMDVVDGGMWKFGDASCPETLTTFTAGTFCEHPLTMEASFQILSYLKEKGNTLYENLNKKTQELVTRLNNFFKQNFIPIKVVRFGSLFRFVLVGDWELLFFQHLLLNGVYVWEGRNCFLSTSHSDEDIDSIYEAVVKSISQMLDSGWVTVDKKLKPDEKLHEFKLSEEQEKLFALSSSNTAASSAFNENQVLEFKGSINKDKLSEAIHLVVNRHQALRAKEFKEGCIIIADEVEVNIEIISTKKIESLLKLEYSSIDELISDKSSKHFDLLNGPFIRFTLIEEAENLCKLLMTTHHLICDGWSLELIWKEIGQVYSSLVKNREPELPHAFALEGFNKWQADIYTRAIDLQAVEYWKNEFAKNYSALKLPTERFHLPSKSVDGDSFSLKIENSLAGKLTSFAKKENTTLFNILLAGYNILLYRLSNQKEFVLGIPSSGQIQIGEKCLVGQCIKMLPLYNSLNPESKITEYIKQLRKQLSNIIEYQNCSFDKILSTSTNLRTPVISTEIDMNSIKNQVEFSGLETKISFPEVKYAKYDISISIIEMDNDLMADFYFNTSLFDRKTVESWASSYISILNDMSDNPDKRILDLNAETLANEVDTFKWDTF